jgi:hypothetical protein
MTVSNQKYDPSMLCGLIWAYGLARDPRTLHVDPSLDGDCSLGPK